MGSEGGKKVLIVMEVVGEGGGGDDDMSYGFLWRLGCTLLIITLVIWGKEGRGGGGMQRCSCTSNVTVDSRQIEDLFSLFLTRKKR